jgi:hypothetical protein
MAAVAANTFVIVFIGFLLKECYSLNLTDFLGDFGGQHRWFLP